MSGGRRRVYTLQTGSQSEAMVLHMIKEPHRIYFSEELCEVAQCEVRHVSSTIRRAIQLGFVAKTCNSRHVAKQGYRLVLRDGKPPQQVSSPYGFAMVKTKPANPLAVLAEEFPVVELSSGHRFPKVARSVFEWGCGV